MGKKKRKDEKKNISFCTSNHKITILVSQNPYLNFTVIELRIIIIVPRVFSRIVTIKGDNSAAGISTLDPIKAESFDLSELFEELDNLFNSDIVVQVANLDFGEIVFPPVYELIASRIVPSLRQICEYTTLFKMVFFLTTLPLLCLWFLPFWILFDRT